MLKSASDQDQSPRPDLSQLMADLAADGRRWAEAEIDLAGIELGELKSQAIKVVSLALLGFAAIFCALVVLSQAGIAFLAPYVGSEGIAALIIGGLLLLLVAISVLAMRSALSWQTESIFLRWFTTKPKPDGQTQ